MKIGVSAFAWTTKINGSHLALLPQMRGHGIEAFEVAIFDPAVMDAPSLRRAFEAADLEASVCAILPPGVNPISPDAAERGRALELLLQTLETSAEMGARKVGGPVYAPIGYLPGRRRNEDEWLWAVECIQSLGETLDKLEIDLAIEPVNRSETFLINTVAEGVAFCEQVNHPRVGVLMDTFHANIEEKSLTGAVRAAGPRLMHLHASENDRGLLGTGHVDFPGIVAALKEINYQGTLMIEGFGYSPNEHDSLGALWGDLKVTPEDIAFKGAKYLQGLLSA